MTRKTTRTGEATLSTFSAKPGLATLTAEAGLANKSTESTDPTRAGRPAEPRRAAVARCRRRARLAREAGCARVTGRPAWSAETLSRKTGEPAKPRHGWVYGTKARNDAGPAVDDVTGNGIDDGIAEDVDAREAVGPGKPGGFVEFYFLPDNIGHQERPWMQ